MRRPPCVFAQTASHAHLERLEAAQAPPAARALRVFESDHADLVHDLLARRRAHDHVAVAVEIWSRRARRHPPLRRLHRTAACIVHDDETGLRMRVWTAQAPVSASAGCAHRSSPTRSRPTAAAVVSVYEPKYQVNVATVEKAYDLLEANGYIRRCQGSGFASALDNVEFFADGVGSTVFRPGSRRPGRSMILPPARRWRRGEETRQFVALADELAQRGRMRSCAIRRRRRWVAASGRAQHLLRLSYVGCPLEQIPEGYTLSTGKSTGVKRRWKFS